MADLGLSDRETKRVMAEADFDGNGEISYAEFIPLAVDLVQSMYAKMEMEAAKAKEEDEAREEAKNYLLHGMTKEEVESVMIDIFHKSDADGSGALSLQEFQKCCRDADIGLTRKEVNILMHQCDVDGDGHISYEEFVPLCFEMLTEILKDELLQEKRTPTELETFLVQIFSEADIDGAGALSPLAMKEVIKSADFGLTRLQIHSVLAEAEYDEDGVMKPVPWGGGHEAAFLIRTFEDSLPLRMAFMGVFTLVGLALIGLDECLLVMAGLVTTAAAVWVGAHLLAVHYYYRHDPKAAREACEAVHTAIMVVFGIVSVVGGRLAHEGTSPSLSGVECSRERFAGVTFGLWNLIHEPAHLTIGFITCAHGASLWHFAVGTIAFEGGIALAYADAYYGASLGTDVCSAGCHDRLVTIGILAELLSYLFGCGMGLGLVTLQRRAAVKSLRIEQLQAERIEQLRGEKERLNYDTQLARLRHVAVAYADPSVAFFTDDEEEERGGGENGGGMRVRIDPAVNRSGGGGGGGPWGDRWQQQQPLCSYASSAASEPFPSSYTSSAASELGGIIWSSAASSPASAASGMSAASIHKPEDAFVRSAPRLGPASERTKPRTRSGAPPGDRPRGTADADAASGGGGSTRARGMRVGQLMGAAAVAQYRRVSSSSHGASSVSSAASASESGAETPKVCTCVERDAALSRTLQDLNLAARSK